jgi:peptide/nickel transport system permease protein
MITYIVRRFSQALVLTFLGSLIIYTVLVYLMPRSPYSRYTQFVALAQAQPDLQIKDPTDPYSTRPGLNVGLQVKELEGTFGLDKPWPLSFLAWLYDPADRTYISHATFAEEPKGLDIRIGSLHITGDGALLGDWGNSEYVRAGQPTSGLIQNRYGNTLLLAVTALVMALLISLSVGILGAVKQDSRLDHTLTFFSVAGLSMPPFVLGLFLIFGFAVIPYMLHNGLGWSWLPFLPPGGVVGLDQEEDWVSRAYHLVLPVTTLVLAQVAWLSRHVRFSMLDVLGKEYIRTAQAKGARAGSVILRHAFRNASLPLVTAMALAVPGVIAGMVVIERLFAYPGMGLLFFDSISRADPDTPLTLILTVIMIVIATTSSMLADIVYGLVDPRIDYRAQRA